MSEQNDVLKEVVKKLEEADFPYMVSGSVASSYYAQPRMTRDIDIVIELNLHNTDALIRAFSEDYYIDDVAARDAIAQTSMFNIIHLASMIKIDFIVRKHSPYRETEFKRRNKVEIDSDWIWFVAPEDLILSKLIWAIDSRSQIQLNDIRSVIKAVKKLDWSYIEHWSLQLGLKDLLNEVRI